jgi:hypothetical protein
MQHRFAGDFSWSGSEHFWPSACFNDSMPIQFAERTKHRDTTSRNTLLERFRSEMRHAPAIALTLQQAARLFNLEPDTCQQLIAALAREGHIQVRSDGRFVSTASPVLNQ